jgi:hypothetical protein
MLIFLKLIHMAALFLGGGAVIGNGLLLQQLMANPGPPPPMVRSVMKQLSKFGLAAIILLWLSGLGMVYYKYGTFELGNWFYAKLIGATIVLGAVLMLTRVASQAEKAGTPPNFQTMKLLAMTGRLGFALALIGAVVTFI